MSKCKLSIRLEDQGRVHLPGDALRGELVVEVNGPCDCRALSLWVGWRTHGKGNRVEGRVEDLSLLLEELMRGVSHRHPFEFRLPAGPVTYHGKLLNVDWHVGARADIPWAIDPKAEADFVLGTGGGGEYHFGPAYKAPAEIFLAFEKGGGWVVFFYITRPGRRSIPGGASCWRGRSWSSAAWWRSPGRRRPRSPRRTTSSSGRYRSGSGSPAGRTEGGRTPSR